MSKILGLISAAILFIFCMVMTYKFFIINDYFYSIVYFGFGVGMLYIGFVIVKYIEVKK